MDISVNLFDIIKIKDLKIYLAFMQKIMLNISNLIIFTFLIFPNFYYVYIFNIILNF